MPTQVIEYWKHWSYVTVNLCLDIFNEPAQKNAKPKYICKSANVQHSWLAGLFLCTFACIMLTRCVCGVCASENCITSPHRTHVCVYSFSVCTVMTRRSDGCCEHKPESLEDRPATQAEKHALCTRDKPLHHFTSAAVGGADCPLPPPRILATAERPPGNASVNVTAFPSNDTAPFQINEMGHRKKNTVHHQILSSALQMSLETRSCFITVRLQSSSPLLSLGIWEHCPYAPLTPAAGWVFFAFFFFFKKRQEQNLSTHDTMPRYSMCCSASMWYTDTLTSSRACWIKKEYK